MLWEGVSNPLVLFMFFLAFFPEHTRRFTRAYAWFLRAYGRNVPTASRFASRCVRFSRATVRYEPGSDTRNRCGRRESDPTGSRSRVATRSSAAENRHSEPVAATTIPACTTVHGALDGDTESDDRPARHGLVRPELPA